MKFISMDEFLMGRAKLTDLSPEQIGNAQLIVTKANSLLEAFGEYRGVSSGLRTMKDHLRIYTDINAKRAKQGLAPVNIPMKSNHLKAAALDLKDPDGKLYKFVINNHKLLESIGLWYELNTQGWVHIQIFSPASGRRGFTA